MSKASLAVSIKALFGESAKPVGKVYTHTFKTTDKHEKGYKGGNIQDAKNELEPVIEMIAPQCVGRGWLEVAEAVSPIVESVLFGYRGIGYDFLMGDDKRLQVILFEECNKQNAMIV